MSQLYPVDEQGFSAAFDGKPFIRAAIKSADDTVMLNFGSVFDGKLFITNTNNTTSNNSFFSMLMYWSQS